MANRDSQQQDSVNFQRAFYNKHWRDAEHVNMLKTARCAAIINAIAKLKIYQPTILDLGCGSGWLAGILGILGPTTGVELSDEAVEKASSRYPYVKFFAANFFEWDGPSERFDVVVSQEVIEHVEDQAGYLKLVHHVLKPGGYLILTTPNPRTFDAMPDKVRESWSRQPIENWIPIPQLKDMIEPHFAINQLTTIIPGYGVKGSYRFVNSRRVKNVFGVVRLGTAFEYLRLKFGYGLHTLVVAYKFNL